MAKWNLTPEQREYVTALEGVASLVRQAIFGNAIRGYAANILDGSLRSLDRAKAELDADREPATT